MNMTNYLTASAIVEKIYCVGDKESFDEIIYQLKKIGNNINQIRMLSESDQRNNLLKEVKEKWIPIFFGTMIGVQVLFQIVSILLEIYLK